jgi:hypothetical protein
VKLTTAVPCPCLASVVFACFLCALPHCACVLVTQPFVVDGSQSVVRHTDKEAVEMVRSMSCESVSSFTPVTSKEYVGASHMSDNRQMSVAMQRLVDLISMVTNSMLLCNNTVTLW